MRARQIDFDFVSQYVSYDKSTGVFTKKKHYGKPVSGIEAGRVSKTTGYLQIKINGVYYNAARIAWVLVNGEIDNDLLIDHIDRNKLNNKYENLRLVTDSENSKNRATILGEPVPRYCTLRKTGKWQVVFRGKYLGVFNSQEAAADRVKQALEREILTPGDWPEQKGPMP